MFDIGSTELLVVAIVALLVLGPERLPEALRNVGLWWGRTRRAFNSVRTEIEREVGMDDVRRQIYNETVLADLEKARRDISQVATDTRAVVTEAANAANSAGIDDTAGPRDAASANGTAHATGTTDTAHTTGITHGTGTADSTGTAHATGITHATGTADSTGAAHATGITHGTGTADPAAAGDQKPATRTPPPRELP